MSAIIRRKFVKRIGDDWEVYVSAKYPNTYFYFNTRTGETTWEPPDPADDVETETNKYNRTCGTDPNTSIEKVNCGSKNPGGAKSPDQSCEEKNPRLLNEVHGRVLGTNAVPSSPNPNCYVMEEPKLLQPSYCESLKNNRVPPNSSSSLAFRGSMNKPICQEGRSEVQGSGRIKLKRSWLESESSKASYEQNKIRKQNVVDKTGKNITKGSSDEVTAVNVTYKSDISVQARITEVAETAQNIPVAGIAERRLIRLKKTLEKQRNQSSAKNNVSSVTTGSENRNPTSMSNAAISERSDVPSMHHIAVKYVESLTTVQGLNPKKNLAAARIKTLHGKLNKDQDKKLLQGNQSSSGQSNKTVCVVVRSSRRNNNDDAEFLEAEEKMLMDVQDLREEIHKAGGVNPEEIEEMLCEIIPSSFPDTKSKLYIVLDTNVLVSNFDSIQNLCDTTVEGIGCPVFIIPWMVLHELDILKDRKDVTKSRLTAVRAQKAIKFLHSCFSSRHPRVIGQTVADAGPNALTSLCNPDNGILHCCLQQVQLGRKLLLLSDDKNLQNKCLVNGVDAIGKSSLMSYLQTLSKQSIREPNKQNALEPNTTNRFVSTSSIQTFEEHSSKVDILLKNLKYCAKEVLSKIILHEMKTAYGDMWLKIICVKPPFTLDDIFTCLLQHWIAVFGLVMSKNSLETVKNLKKICGGLDNKRKDSKPSLGEVKNTVIRFVRLLTEMTKPLYNSLMKEATSYLEDLATDCENPFSCPTSKEGVSFSEPSSEWVLSKHTAVVENIRKIWYALVELCQHLRTLMLQDQHPLEVTLTVSLSKNDLETWVSYFYGPVSNLCLLMESIVGAKAGEEVLMPTLQSVASQMYKEFSELYQLLSSGEHIKFGIEELISFCEDCDTSDVFNDIKEHFHNFVIVMRQAIDYFSKQDLLPFASNSCANNATLPDDVEMEELYNDIDKSSRI